MYEKFDIEKNDIISIVGSGGKTTLMFTLARELKKLGRVLVTTSTKIGIPNDLKEDEIFYRNPSEIKGGNLVVVGGDCTDKKVSSISQEDVEALAKDFDYILIEADGSKQLPYKASRENEPVIFNISTKTIAVLPMFKYNNELTEDDIFNYKLFKERFGSTYLDDELIIKMAKHKEGLFKNSVGEKYLYLNRINNNINNLEKQLENLKIKLRR